MPAMDQSPPQPMPYGERAVVEIEKLRDYCLSPTHLRGRHKAKVFLARLGLTAEHAEWLRESSAAGSEARTCPVGQKGHLRSAIRDRL